MADSPTESEDPAGVPQRIRWQSLFQLTRQPIFVLGANRRIRYVNSAWEQLTGRKLRDIWGTACARSGPIEPLFRSLTPPGEATRGEMVTVRRPTPGQDLGPPWWSITYLPLMLTDRLGDRLGGFVGVIEVIGADAPAPRNVPKQIAALRQKLAGYYTFDLFTGPGAETELRLNQIRMAADSRVPVWIVGEPGSGKETLARVIHARSSQREKHFLAIDCQGLQPYLIESLLFGKGGVASISATATCPVGTLYLKNPLALTRDLQAQLQRWLALPQAPRLISGASVTARQALIEQRIPPEFRSQFSVLELAVPPLRERLDELPRILERLATRLEPRPVLDNESMQCLRLYGWPGNLRELFEVLVEAHTHAKEGQVKLAHLPRYLREATLFAKDPLKKITLKPLDEVLLEVEKRMIQLALRMTKGNQTEAASLLGIFRARLGRRIEALGITVSDNRSSPP